MNKDSLVYSAGAEELRAYSTVQSSKARPTIFDEQEPAPIVITSSNHFDDRQVKHENIHNHDSNMTEAKKSLTLHKNAINESDLEQSNQDIAQKHQFQDFQTYLQTVTKSHSSKLEYTLNEHSSEKKNEERLSNPTHLVHVQKAPDFNNDNSYVPLQGQLPQMQYKNQGQRSPQPRILDPSEVQQVEPRKIVTKQSSLLAKSKPVENIQLGMQPGMQPGMQYTQSSEYNKPTSNANLPPKPVQGSTKREISSNRIAPSEVNLTSTNISQPVREPTVIYHGNSNPFYQSNTSFDQRVVESSQTGQLRQIEQRPSTGQQSPQVYAINTKASQPTMKRSDSISAQIANQMQPQTQIYHNNRKSLDCEQLPTLQLASHSNRPQDNHRFASNIRNQVELRESRIEAVTLPTISIPPKPKMIVPEIRQIHQIPAQQVVYSHGSQDRKLSELRQPISRNSQTFSQSGIPVNDRRIENKVVTQVQGQSISGSNGRVFFSGEEQIIENSPYIYDETGKKVYIDPANFSQYAKMARKAPAGVTQTHLSSTLRESNSVQIHQISPQAHPVVKQQISGNRPTSIKPGTTNIININGVQTEVRYVQNDSGQIVAIPTSNPEYNGESHRQREVITNVENKQYKYRDDDRQRSDRHRSRKEKKEKSNKSSKHRDHSGRGYTDYREGQDASIHVYQFQKPHMNDDDEHEFRHESRSRSGSYHSTRSRSKDIGSRKGSRSNKNDPNYKALKIEDVNAKAGSRHYSSTSNSRSIDNSRQYYSSAHQGHTGSR